MKQIVSSTTLIYLAPSLVVPSLRDNMLWLCCTFAVFFSVIDVVAHCLIRALQLQRNAGRVAEQEGFLQTRCHGQSVTKLVMAPKLQRKCRNGARMGYLDAGVFIALACQGRWRREGARMGYLDAGVSIALAY